jgi:hypothetical protein
MQSSFRITLIFVFIFALFGIVFAACEISTSDATEFDLNFQLSQNGLADVTMYLAVPFTQECFTQLNLSAESFDCPAAILTARDALFQGLGFFSTQGGCKGSFSNDELRLVFSAATDMLVNKLQNETIEITFRQWDMVDAEKETLLKNKLTIIVPPGAKLVSFYPLSEPYAKADFDNGIIVWEPIPGASKKPSVRYTMENNNLLIILIALLVIVIIGAGGFFFFSKSQQYKLIDEMKTLKIKMTVLEQDFMKGKMDETTYRRLM